MSKPLSRPEEVGRAVGYQIDADLLLERLKQAAPNGLVKPEHDEALLKQLSRAAEFHGSSRAAKPLKRLWVVIKIERSVPVMIDAYRDKRSANKRAEFLRLHMNADLDQVQVFAIPLDHS